MKTMNQIATVVAILITSVITNIKDACVKTWQAALGAESVIANYVTKEFNLPVFFDEDTKKVLTSYNYGSTIKVSKETAMTRFNKMAELQNKLYEATRIQAEKLSRLTELTELEELVRELNKAWSQDHFGERSNFPENEQLFNLRQEIIATDESLIELQKEYWSECSAHRESFGKFLTKQGISTLYVDSYQRESYAEAIRFLTPMKYISDIKAYNVLNSQKNYSDKYDEEVMQEKRDSWYAEDRTLEAEEKAKQEAEKSPLAEMLEMVGIRLFKVYSACQFMTEKEDLENISTITQFISLNKEMLKDEKLHYKNGNRPTMWSIFFSLFDLYDNKIIAEDEFFNLCNAEDKDEFKAACQAQHERVEYMKECIRKGTIEAYKKCFWPLSNIYNKANITLTINGVDYSFPTVQGAMYALMLKENIAPIYIKMLAAADDFEDLKIAANTIRNSNVVNKNYDMKAIKNSLVAQMLESNDSFKKALWESRGLKFKSQDPEWDKILNEARETLIKAKEARIAELIEKMTAEKTEKENYYAEFDNEEIVTAKYRIAMGYLSRACEVAQTMVMTKEELA